MHKVSRRAIRKKFQPIDLNAPERKLPQHTKDVANGEKLYRGTSKIHAFIARALTKTRVASDTGH